MFKTLLATVLALFAAAAFAVDVNKATQAELEAVKGIGPTIATKILDERKKSSFKDWGDMVERVKGVGDGNAAKFSAEGLTVNGSAFKGAAPSAAAAKKDDKPAAKVAPDTAKAAPAAGKASATTATAAAAATAKPAAAASAAKPADDKKAMAMKEKEDKKEAAAKAKADKKAEKAKAADGKASEAKK